MSQTSPTSQTNILAAPPESLNKQVRFSKDELIIKEGDTANEAYILLDGEVQVYSGAGQSRVDLCRIGQNGIFGEMALIDNGPRSASVVALTPCVCLIVRRAQIDAAMDKTTPLLRGLMRILTSNLRATTERLSGEEAHPTSLSRDVSALLTPHKDMTS